MPANKTYDDKKYVNPETLHLYANTNEDFVIGPVKGIVIEFPGLGGGSCLGGSMDIKSYASGFAKDFGKNGIILAYLFPGPWSWGNKGSIRMAEAVIEALAEKYDLGDNFPLVSCGGSMGGHGSLMFAIDSHYKLTAVAAACPCLDPTDRMYAHQDFARTFISAAAVYDCDLETALRTFSPSHRMDELPKVPYFFCSDGDDEVLPSKDCDEYVETLRSRGYSVEYLQQPGLLHGDFFPYVRQALHDFIKKQILG